MFVHNESAVWAAAMHPIVLRVFLLLLLAVDWVTDPWQGASPSSQPLSSTEVVCRSLTIASEGGDYSPSPWLYHPEPAGDFYPAVTPHLVRPARVFILSGADLAYLFMSMQR